MGYLFDEKGELETLCYAALVEIYSCSGVLVEKKEAF